MTHPALLILIFSFSQNGAEAVVGCRPLQAGPKVTPEITIKYSFRYCADNGIKYTAELPRWANHSQTMLITSSWHVSRCGFSLGPLFIISRVWKHAAVQYAWLFRYTFYTKKPWREPINCQFRERGESALTVHVLPQTCRRSLRAKLGPSR